MGMKSGKRANLQEMLNLPYLMILTKRLFSDFFRLINPPKQENQ